MADDILGGACPDRRRRAEEFNELKDEGRRIDKTLKCYDAAKRYKQLADILREKYYDFESAEDYAREFQEKGEKLSRAHERRAAYEKISCLSASAAVVLVSVLYIVIYVREGKNFEPFFWLTAALGTDVCGCLIGYISSKGSAPSLLGAFGFTADIVATAVLAIAYKSAGGVPEYFKLLFIPLLLGTAAGILGAAVWSICAKALEKT